MEKLVNVQVYVPEPVKTAFKMATVKRGETMREAIERFMREYTKGVKK
jgi:hypothetical protein